MHYRILLSPITKKNSARIITNRRTGKPMVLPSKQYAAYEEAAGYFLPRPQEPIAEPVNVKAIFYMPTRRRVDLVNLQEALLDVLVKYRIIADDNCTIVASMDGSRVDYDKQNPRTEIEIESLF